MRLNRQAAGMQVRVGAAQFNLCPMSREHNAIVRVAFVCLDGHLIFRDHDGLHPVTALHGRMQGPAEHQHLESREREHRPESAQRHAECHREAHGTHACKEEGRRPGRQGAVGRELDRDQLEIVPAPGR